MAKREINFVRIEAEDGDLIILDGDDFEKIKEDCRDAEFKEGKWDIFPVRFH
jgi:hypothetical protein